MFSHELRPGDRVVLEDGQEWQVVDHPEGSTKQRKAQRVNLQKRGDPSTTRTEHWPGHERVAVGRG